MKILEKYMSRWVLPRENILSWVKWDDSIGVDQVIVRSEADIEFKRFFNVDKSVLEQSMEQGKIVIDRDMMQLKGFVGFECAYTLIPESERHLCFKVDFLKKGKVLKQAALSTKLVRPIIVIEQRRNTVTPDADAIPMTFVLSNKGKAAGRDLMPFIKSISSDKMTITIEYVKEKPPHTADMPFVRVSEQVIPKFVINGSGKAVFSMGFKYEDDLCNEYNSELTTISVSMPQRTEMKVPIRPDLKNQPMMILTHKGF